MSRLNQFHFTQAEKDELAQKIAQKFIAAGIHSIIAVGSSNITYLSTGIVFPYIDQKLVQPVAVYLNFKTNRRILACTFDLADIPEQLGWDGETVVYELTEATPEASLAVALSKQVAQDLADGEVLGADYGHMSTRQLTSFQTALPHASIQSVDHILTELRMIKTAAEVRLLEIAGRMGDRGFISALNHSEGAALDTLSYPMWEYGERFRVHVAEFGGSGVGNLSVLQGARGRDLYSKTGTRETFNEGEFLRLEYSAHSFGYWTTGARTVFIGYPDSDAKQAYANNLVLKTAAFNALVAGNRASDVYAAVVTTSEKRAIPFWEIGDLGHGIGASEREAPYLAPYDETVLAAGMVVVVAVYTFNSKQELLCNKDIFLITDSKPELLTWYKNWGTLYALHGTSARHG
ncbi:MAG: M24 family metallopeptidase [Chloroflexota bacterium]